MLKVKLDQGAEMKAASGADARVLLKSNRYAALFRQGGRYVLGLKMADGTLCCSEYVTRSEAEDMYRYVSNKMKKGEEV